MRHNKKFNHLSRTSSHRASMLANMACSLIRYKRITTTVAKAKALRKYVEPIITKCKDDTTNSRRVIFSYLKEKEAVKELFKEISVKVAERPGGYTRIIKLGTRQDDGASMCFIEFVDFDENMAKTAKKKARTRRAGRHTAAKEQVADAQDAVAEEVKADTEAAAPAEEPKAEATPAEEAPAAEEPKAE
jgi:large subunit ribosomal protein L17